MATLLLPGALAAQDLPADTIRPLPERGCCLSEVQDGAEVRDFEIDGNQALTETTIENALYTSESGTWPWSEDRYLSKDEFLKDLERIHILYQRNGYFSMELLSYDVRPVGDGVSITLTISEGEPTLVERLEIEELTALGAELEEEMIGRIPLKQGEVFNEADLLASRILLESEFKNRGYAYATVLLEYRIDKEVRTAEVIYSVDAGDQYYIGETRIEGYDPDDLDLVQGQLEFASGELYDLEEILQSQRNLYQLGLFRRVLIEPQLASVRADTVDVLVSLAPAPTHVVRVGVGYGTEELVRIRTSWIDRNLYGGARQLEVRGQYSKLEREAAVTYRLPTFIVPEASFMTSAFLRFEIEDNYTVERLGGTVRTAWREGQRWQARAGFTAEHDDYSEFDEGVLIPELGREFINPSRLVYAEVGVTFDNTDSLFHPSRGWTANLGYQVGLPILTGDYAYNRLVLLVTRYLEIREGWVLAGKVLPGVIFGYGGEKDRVPLFQRLFAGGANSVRGYERRQLGPKDDPESFGQERNPEPVGGRGGFETSLELRFPLRGNLSGAAFVDAGNVWRDPDDISLGDLKYTPGVGVRYRTPVGPIRLDVAHRTASDEDFLPKWVFHISIGNAF
ncbi:MAG TPA: outer membrane protein assembly factor BamA [Gemmatimonadota bacterium]|nr:outer membrane protein assembly factor BamA [Gemmatimonadota bacterium]